MLTFLKPGYLAATKGIESATGNDAQYLATQKALVALEVLRDHLANTIKTELANAEFNGATVSPLLATVRVAEANGIISAAKFLAAA